jgi:hypothetical protein
MGDTAPFMQVEGKALSLFGQEFAIETPNEKRFRHITGQ